ncbi:MAG: UvrD-helicase domain-containing protein [Gammaproteobacteria bacterium]|nr:UvrD-helicase domain-containing protein [Gammaproteobacteria bacterium]
MDEKEFNTLNEDQREACAAAFGPSLIIAGAGSGKTRVLTYRIAYLIKDLDVHPRSILAITFTNKAAKEMRDRLDKLIGDEARYVTAQTFHSFCSSFLRREIGVLDRSTRFTIIDDDETETIIKNIMKELRYDNKAIKPQVYADAISKIKARISKIEEYDNYFGDKLSNLMSLYNQELLRQNLVDFDDLILLTMEILENHPDILEKYQNIYKYILVDEFQDTSNIQYDLVHILGMKHRNVFIVGDEDQSIYSFRGANITNIKKFMRDFPDYQKFVLSQNYRSTKNILDCANKLISNNKDRIPKDLWTDKKTGEDVKYMHVSSDKAEAREIVAEIDRLVEYNNYTYKDVAILYRNNYLSRNLENELILKRIPYKIYSGISFYKRKEVKDLISYLRLVIDPEDFYSFKRVINSPKRGVGDSSLEKIETAIKAYGLNIKDATLNSGVKKSVVATVESFFTMINSFRERVDKMKLKEFLYLVYKESGYEDFIDTLDEDEKEARHQNVQELFNAISETQSVTVLETLTDFLDNVTLMTDLDTESSDDNSVSLMTMHTAKGLEFKCVFLCAIESGILPSIRAYSEKDKEEERRLFYVAITRAKERLYITYAEQRFVNGATEFRSPSPFLKEIITVPENMKRVTYERKDFSNAKDTFDMSYHAPKREFKKGEFNVGDRINHVVMGKGTIKGEVEGFYIILFDNNKSPKKVIVGHPFLSKAE